MTGVTFESAGETYGKRLQILKEIALASLLLEPRPGAEGIQGALKMSASKRLLRALSAFLAFRRSG
jgi:hypothetical protein